MNHNSNIMPIGNSLKLSLGGEIQAPQIEYRLVGKPNAPVILVMGGISADMFVTNEEQLSSLNICDSNDSTINLKKGWWHDIAGPAVSDNSNTEYDLNYEPALSTDKFRILSIEFLGGNGRSSSVESPLSFDRNNTILPQDQANAIALLLDKLNITKLHAVVGNSYGGFVAQAFAIQYPSRLNQVFVICCAHTTPNKAKANRAIQRQIIKLTLESPNHKEGLKLARSLAMLSYRADDEFDGRFSAQPYERNDSFRFEFEDYLDRAGDHFVNRFCPYAYITLSQSIDLFEINPEEIKVPIVTVAFDTDVLIPERLVKELSDNSSSKSSHYLIQTPFGHDGFLKETQALNKIFNRHIKSEAAPQTKALTSGEHS